MQTRKVDVPDFQVRALINPQSINVEERTVEFTFSTGAQVRRFDFMNGEFIEELSLKKDAVRLDRFNAGAPLLTDHMPSARNIVGVILEARVFPGKKEGVAKTKFGRSEDAERFFQDVQDGIIRNVSIGYRVFKFDQVKSVKEGDREIPVLRAVDWEPFELSLVAIPADARAQVRSSNSSMNECEIVMSNYEGEDDMKRTASEQGADSQVEETKESGSQVSERTQEETVNVEELRSEAIDAERKRSADITMVCRKHNMSDEFTQKLVSEGTSVEQARELILDKLASADKETNTRTQIEVGNDNARDARVEGMANAMLHRMNPAKNELKEVGHHYRNRTFIQIAEDCLQAQGVETRGLSNIEIAGRVLGGDKVRGGAHSTSDFPLLLENVLNKTIRDSYEQSPRTFQPITTMTSVSDFKEISRTQLSETPKLLEKPEGAEYRHGSMSEQAEKYSVKDYGRIVAVTRRMIVNDDLRAFADMPRKFGVSAANLESDLTWGEITSNPLMADGNAVFSAAHGNLAAAGAVLSTTSLGVARAAMRVQKGLEGNHLNLRPSLIGAPVAIESTVDQLLTAITPDQSGNVNVFAQGGRSALGSIIEPRLDDNSATAWYVFSNLDQVDMIELAQLAGEMGPVVDSMEDFDTDGIKFKVRYTLGAKIIDYRGMYKNPGA